MVHDGHVLLLEEGKMEWTQIRAAEESWRAAAPEGGDLCNGSTAAPGPLPIAAEIHTGPSPQI